jgi:mannosylglucosylglycerate synthase
MKVVLLHYAFPPAPGGVETVMAAQAAWMARKGWEVLVLTGSGSEMPGVTVEIIPKLSATHPMTASVQRQLGDPVAEDRDPTQEFTPDFLFNLLVAKLSPLVHDADHVLVHNVMTMPFHLALTKALAHLAAKKGPRTTWWNWIHDVALLNPDHRWCHVPGEWTGLLAEPWDSFRHVAVSHYRASQYAKSTGLDPAKIRVIPNGIDPIPTAKPNAGLCAWIAKKKAGGAFPLLFHPARLLPRKGIATSLDILNALLSDYPKAMLVISGASDPHRPAMRAHANWLKERVEILGLSSAVTFLGDLFALGAPEIHEIYRHADAVLFPSREEGFGLPVLEAALHGKPCFAPLQAPFTEFPAPLGQWFHEPGASPAAIAQNVHLFLQSSARPQRKVWLADIQRAVAAYDVSTLMEKHVATLFQEP